MNSILHSIVSNVGVYIGNQQICISNGPYLQKVYISRVSFVNRREFCTARLLTLKDFLRELSKSLCLNFFQKEIGKNIGDAMAPCCMGVDFFSHLNCYDYI